MLRKYFILILILLCPALTWAYGEPPDSQGKDFWLAFMPNFHNNNNPDSLYIFVTSDYATDVNVEFFDGKGNSEIRTKTIANPREIVSFVYYYVGHEFRGDAHSGDNPGNRELENGIKKSFHISSDEDVSVYCLNKAETSSEAFLVTPTDALGNYYFVSSYKSSLFREDNILDDGDSFTPSQFMIVATEDDTQIELSLTPGRTMRAGGDHRAATLMEGEAYLVQAKVDCNWDWDDLEYKALRDDVTGSIIISDKPVAVFSGHQRARIPEPNASRMGSRDCLIEQMTPVLTWGMSGIVTNFVDPVGYTNYSKNDIFRVIAAYDNTDIYINGVLIETINKSEYYQGAIEDNYYIESNNPILIASYKGTSNFVTTNSDVISDPFMMLVQTESQYMDHYTVINIETNIPGADFIDHYLTCTIPSNALASLKLDGQPVTDYYSVEQVPGTDMLVVNLKVEAGTHNLEADQPFGLNIYGYGRADSYGYIGGLAYPSCSYFSQVDTTVSDNETFTINLDLNEIMDINQYPYDSLYCLMSFDRDFLYYEDLFFPDSAEVESWVDGSKRYVRIFAKYDSIAYDLLTMQFTTMLNDTACVDIIVDSLEFYAPNKEPNYFNSYCTELPQITICSEMCQSGGERHFVPGNTTLDLKMNVPNPFCNVTDISFSLIETSHVDLEVYNSLGEKVKVLLSRRMPSGEYTVQFNAEGLATGRYYYVLKTGSALLTRSMDIIK